MTEQEILQYISEHVQPILDSYGAKIVARKCDFYNICQFNYHDHIVTLDTQSVSDCRAIHLFMQNFNTVLEILEDLNRINAPFYSDITRKLRSKLGKNQCRNGRSHLAFSFICEKLRERGKRIWS